MQRFIIAFIALVACVSASAAGFADEAVHYKVEYKWGLINKTAGHVTLTLRNRGDRYSCNLKAASAPWADKFFKVRDTLRCEIIKDGFLPVFYEKISNEGKERKHDYVAYSRSGGVVTGDCLRKKWKDGKLTTDETRVLTSEGRTLDMLSAFYYMRDLPYHQWSAGHKVTATIFSGKRKELLTIKYIGIEEVKYDERSYKCYHIRFTFTSDGGKKSSDDMDAWIDTSGNHIPVKMEGSLPIGKIRCFYTG